MVRRLGTLVLGLTLGLLTLTVAPAQAEQRPWAQLVPERTTQVVRTISSREHCRQVWCTVTQAWEKDADGRWTKRREFRSTIGSNGWGKEREGDRRSPNGVFEIKTTFTTTSSNPGEMRWKQRRATSIVSSSAGSTYNTWLEVRGVTSGDRPSMRSGWVLDFNNVRLRRGAGPAPVQGAGSGIFYHTSKPGHPWSPTAGCTQVGNARQMRWLLTWLDPAAKPRVVQNR
ncbi:L,D-transpeptidase family protein [Nocardioides sp. SR21]|uniref:L,D-transpeptidase family protein n=1 Tax=Nocardioides sp. SR21 TaxID=2919501 RepID=UPI001FAA2F93|nr:L,D-transpeptidase family protein [Nocardioides sp. SR21]